MQVSPGVFQYDLTLNNTGTTAIGTSWFSVSPTNVMSPAGWTDTLTNTGASIQWLTATPIAPGTSVSGFIFDSTVTPAQFMGTFAGPGLGAGDPITTATIYIAAPSGDPRAQITATTAAVVGTPEPSWLSLAAIAMGLLALAAGISRKRVVSL
jgi:hypothetical protein